MRTDSLPASFSPTILLPSFLPSVRPSVHSLSFHFKLSQFPSKFLCTRIYRSKKLSVWLLNYPSIIFLLLLSPILFSSLHSLSIHYSLPQFTSRSVLLRNCLSMSMNLLSFALLFHLNIISFSLSFHLYISIAYMVPESNLIDY